MSEVLRVEGLSKHFGGLIAVDQVDFQIRKDETTGIIGPNGSGKTTFFNLISGLIPPTTGRIIFFGNEITHMSSNQRVQQGMVRTFQLVSVFNSLSVWENLVLSSIRFERGHTRPLRFLLSEAKQEGITKSCLKTLKLLGLQGNALTPTSELSYGSKRLLEIGIALSLNPKLLLLDEPLSGLSDFEISEVLGILQTIRERLTLVIIEHKVSKIVNLVDRLSVLNEGQFICEGEPEEVLGNPAVRECYWGKEEMKEGSA